MHRQLDVLDIPAVHHVVLLDCRLLGYIVMDRVFDCGYDSVGGYDRVGRPVHKAAWSADKHRHVVVNIVD